MKIGAALPLAGDPVMLPRRVARSRQPDAASSPACSSAATVQSELPTPVADRLGWLMAADPALAQAINAQLPAARQSSARDLAAYFASSRPPRVDVSG